ncbi:MAG: DUF3015 family protein [Proteobacteria bacterium]|nr:DUF3015 family protein [Pseudomonadota bacterium]
MKKILFALIICAVACNIAYAGAGLKKNCGCGLGSILFENNEGLMSQTAAATTNGLLGNQTFGISSGTLECNQPAEFYGSLMLHKFVAENMDNLAKDIARGQGESLNTLALLMGVPDKSRSTFNTKLQTNFDSIFTSPQVTEADVIEHIVTITQNI